MSHATEATELDTAPNVPGGEAAAQRPTVVSKRHSRRSYWLRRTLLACDLTAVSAGLLIALALDGRHNLPAEWAVALPLLPAVALLMRAYGLYDGHVRRISYSVLDDIPPLFNMLLITGILLWLYYRYVTPPRLIYAEVVVFGAASALLVLAARSAAFHLFTRLVGPERVVFVGIEDAAAPALVNKVRNRHGHRLEPIGMIEADGSGAVAHSLPVLGRLGDPKLAGVIERLGVDRIVVGHLRPEERTRVAELVRGGQRHGLEVSILPQLFDLVGPAAELDEIEGLTMLTVHPPVLSRSSRMLKRGLDVIVSSLALVLLAPLLGAIALAVRLDSRGPALFRQTRIGKEGRRFRLLKFRTMVNDAEGQTHKLMAGSQDPNWLLLEHDPRITRLGRVLRRTSLDELPQLWNVLRGEMSLVGPRPLSETDARSVRGWGRARLDLVPGLTGLWQVLGRTSIPFEEMVTLDTVYIANWSLWGDVKLLIRTLPILLRGQGVN